jgi:hypothetical protein
MWKLVFVFATLAVSTSPLDAAPDEGRKLQKSELRRDVERISKEIYPRQEQPARPAGGRALKKR